MRSALSEMGAAVSNYFTPEEKVAFAKFAETRRVGMSPADVDAFAVPLAQSAGLAELEARWRYELMMDKSKGVNSSLLLSRMQPLVDLQRRRLKFAELGAQLEQFAPRIEPQQRYVVWVAAQQAYQSAADPEGELRAFSRMPSGNGGREQQTRLFQLLLTRKPVELVQRASYWTSPGQDAADYLVANGNAAQAHALILSRGRTQTPVWARAYNALVGLYFSERTPEVNSAFVSALGDDTIAERLAKPVDRAQQLAGNVWFYYGSRYGEYTAMNKQGNPEDFLAAMLEQSPATASGYLTVAESRRAGQSRYGLLQGGRPRRGHRGVEAGFFHARATGQQWAYAGDFLGGFLSNLRAPAQQKAVQRSEIRCGCASTGLPPPLRQLPL
jgi:hypothetical protein